MKTISFKFGDGDDGESFDYNLCEVMLAVRGAVVFSVPAEPDDLDPLMDVINPLVFPQGDDPMPLPPIEVHEVEQVKLIEDDGTELVFRYSGTAPDGTPSGCAIGFGEDVLAPFWREHSGTLVDEAVHLSERAKFGDTASEAALLKLRLVIEGLRFVSGERANFAAVLNEWAALVGREVSVHFPSFSREAA